MRETKACISPRHRALIDMYSSVLARKILNRECTKKNTFSYIKKKKINKGNGAILSSWVSFNEIRGANKKKEKKMVGKLKTSTQPVSLYVFSFVLDVSFNFVLTRLLCRKSSEEEEAQNISSNLSVMKQIGCGVVSSARRNFVVVIVVIVFSSLIPFFCRQCHY